ncbi:MAG: Holliday junction branch migration DNA helicase RuvB [bacterium]
MSDRILNPKEEEVGEKEADKSLRPKMFSDLIGREREKQILRVMIDAAKSRNESLDHVIFHGPPGLGKTSIAFVIANEMGKSIHVTSGPAIERAGDLASIITNLQDGDILFIDEIHRLSKVVEEVLYPAMEDFAIDIILGKGPSAKSVRIDLPHFTIIGATTKIGMVSAPLRDRFGSLMRLDFYNTDELKQMVLQKAKILNVEIDEPHAKLIAERSRGTARIAIRLLKRVRDFTNYRYNNKVTKEDLEDAMKLLQIDNLGLDENDRKILKTIITNFEGGPVGLGTIAASLSEEEDTIADVYEPYLIQIGFLQRTPKGRVATKKAYEYLGLDFTADSLDQSSLL